MCKKNPGPDRQFGKEGVGTGVLISEVQFRPRAGGQGAEGQGYGFSSSTT